MQTPETESRLNYHRHETNLSFQSLHYAYPLAYPLSCLWLHCIAYPNTRAQPNGQSPRHSQGRPSGRAPLAGPGWPYVAVWHLNPGKYRIPSIPGMFPRFPWCHSLSWHRMTGVDSPGLKPARSEYKKGRDSPLKSKFFISINQLPLIYKLFASAPRLGSTLVFFWFYPTLSLLV